MKIIVASNNEHKIKEIKAILSDLDVEIRSLKDEGIDVDPEETGATFMENALIKARTIYEAVRAKERKTKREEGAGKDKKGHAVLVLADDSGLSVDYLNGAPGVFSARYAGRHGDDRANNEKLLADLAGVPLEERKAKFVCAMALVGHKVDLRVTGEAKGYIIEEAKGFEGFGYDPLFFSNDLAKTFAEASGVEKNSVSHRGRALAKLRKELVNL
ncbi:Nucleoside 5-triphosphatase RdgB (dHAPTP, dITP, XTP-specific) [Clostridiaceae bacterium JG1575]|nr:Nucleoside 5-triphosphatase RdgB (dHAPTP, dITP, XTP-specific) [Clostridiaceae bacterium JG1575]